MTKNNTQVSLRTGNLDDAESVKELQREVLSESEFMISVIEEFEETTEQLRNWIQRILVNERETLIVAETEGKVVGLIVFRSKNTKRLSHTGSFTAMVNKAYRDRGIGKLLIKELLNWTEQNPLIEKISLGVLSTNQRAIGLYKSMGFVEEGRKIKEVKFKEDLYVDDILMYKLV
ncbi:ribosomal protein S18 acetylase RimI-like enzyme [Peribacillus huizhouensis]|uniref:Ribosomal protein S18 acetylase RimI-like enzyme n=2 Tax=Peribacillus huizhouensis TaxID=1501239 RepID=A0ABR6CUL4_9BACI|nr:ribosomal protein S18 acetylase RimI-like enzyme [Peribacillus huizhouensis]